MSQNNYCYYYEYVESEGNELFTTVCLPDKVGKFPTIIYRCPYQDYSVGMTDDESAKRIFDDFARGKSTKEYKWVENGYAIVFQHCRGTGKSGGEFIPYIHEREDGLNLQEWVRKQSFYNGELYLAGSSYTSTVHFATAPFADDIKAAVFIVQDCERYNIVYRNGFFKIGLHGGWYVEQYKKKNILSKNYTIDSYKTLPLIDFSKTVFGETAEDFNELLLHPDKSDEFWNTRLGGAETRYAVKHANIPILFVAGFYDIYTGGAFDMWNSLDDETRSKSVLMVHPFDHSEGNNYGPQPIEFENSQVKNIVSDYLINWFESARGKSEFPLEKGKITYYELFGRGWCTDDFKTPEKQLEFTLGEGEREYVYNPYNPATFKGGLSTNFGGAQWQDEPNSRYDILSFFTPEFEEDTTINGKIRAKLRVKSDCEDTCFYVRLSLCKEEGYYGLRDDINQISNFNPDYKPGEEIDMEFTFDEHAFVVHKGEKIRIDVSSSAFPHYVPHTNCKGNFALQTTAKIAHNTVILNESNITLSVK